MIYLTTKCSSVVLPSAPFTSAKPEECIEFEGVRVPTVRAGVHAVASLQDGV